MQQPFVMPSKTNFIQFTMNEIVGATLHLWNVMLNMVKDSDDEDSSDEKKGPRVNKKLVR